MKHRSIPGLSGLNPIIPCSQSKLYIITEGSIKCIRGLFPQSNGSGFHDQDALIRRYFLTGFRQIGLGLHVGNQNRLHHRNTLLLVVKYVHLSLCKLWQLVP